MFHEASPGGRIRYRFVSVCVMTDFGLEEPAYYESVWVVENFGGSQVFP